MLAKIFVTFSLLLVISTSNHFGECGAMDNLKEFTILCSLAQNVGAVPKESETLLRVVGNEAAKIEKYVLDAEEILKKVQSFTNITDKWAGPTAIVRAAIKKVEGALERVNEAKKRSQIAVSDVEAAAANARESSDAALYGSGGNATNPRFANGTAAVNTRTSGNKTGDALEAGLSLASDIVFLCPSITGNECTGKALKRDSKDGTVAVENLTDTDGNKLNHVTTNEHAKESWEKIFKHICDEPAEEFSRISLFAHIISFKSILGSRYVTRYGSSDKDSRKLGYGTQNVYHNNSYYCSPFGNGRGPVCRSFYNWPQYTYAQLDYNHVWGVPGGEEIGISWIPYLHAAATNLQRANNAFEVVKTEVRIAQRASEAAWNAVLEASSASETAAELQANKSGSGC
ncbi:Trypanosomal VSG domain [Trypanosoma vivax]|nr:hypothetical protein TRVL_05134 [Trypanosoma vivax]KAH8604036.1 Trypanosomal VSG domain [Trypanosoma vivax]